MSLVLCGFIMVNIFSILIVWEPKIYRVKNYLILQITTNKKHKNHLKKIILFKFKN